MSGMVLAGLDAGAYARPMDQIGNTLGGLLETAGDAISGLFSGLLGAFTAAVGDLAAIVPGGAVGILIILVGAIAFGWFLLRR